MKRRENTSTHFRRQRGYAVTTKNVKTQIHLFARPKTKTLKRVNTTSTTLPKFAKIKVVSAEIKHAPPKDAPHGFFSAHKPKCEEANNTAQIPNESDGLIDGMMAVKEAFVRKTVFLLLFLLFVVGVEEIRSALFATLFCRRLPSLSATRSDPSLEIRA